MKITRGIITTQEPAPAPEANAPLAPTESTALVEAPVIEARREEIPPFTEKPAMIAATGPTHVAVGPYMVDVNADSIVARHRRADDNPDESGHLTMWTLSGPDGKLLVTAVFIPITEQAVAVKGDTQPEARVDETVGSPDREVNPDEEVGQLNPVDKG